MLYYLFDYLESHFNFPGAGLFQFITFRAAAAFILALSVSTIYGKRIINFLRTQQVGESIRDLGLEGQIQKAGTPTMGGIIIIISTLIPVLLLTKLDNIYIIILLITTVWMGLIGFLDDYIKVFKKDKEGLQGKFKILGQVGLGLIVGSMLYFNDNVTIKEELPLVQQVVQQNGKTQVFGQAHKSTKTTVPFFKNNELDYSDFLSFLGEGYEKYGWLVFIFITIFIITAVSNGANLTDGIDGFSNRLFSYYSNCFRDFCLGVREYYFLRLFRCYVYPKFWRNDSIHLSFCRSFDRFSVVQHLSSTSFYGRYRQSNNWRYNSCDRNFYS